MAYKHCIDQVEEHNTRQWVVLWVDVNRVQMQVFYKQVDAEAHMQQLHDSIRDSVQVFSGYDIRSYVWRMGLQERL